MCALGIHSMETTAERKKKVEKALDEIIHVQFVIWMFNFDGWNVD